MKVKKVSLAVVIPAIALLACVGVYFGVKAYSGGAPKYLAENGDINVTEAVQPVAEPTLGAFPGNELFEPVRFGAGFGNNVLTTSSIGSATTLKESDLLDYDIIEFTSYMSNFTYTLPATSTLSALLSNVGDSRRWIFKNANTSTSATTLTILKGSGWDLMGVDANVDVLAAGSVGVMDCYREQASSTSATNGKDITCGIQELIAAD